MLWRFIAWIVTRQEVFDWLLSRSMKTPYSHIASADGSDVYMFRFWLFNPYGKDAAGEVTPPRWTWLPSIRIHRIMRPDQDRDLHDHPWNARTIVLAGYYEEERPADIFNQGPTWRNVAGPEGFEPREVFIRTQGYTGKLLFGQYHRITEVPPGGVFTLFFTWKKRGTWGFMVDGHKVPWREYLGVK